MIELLFLILLVEAITEILTKSNIFYPLRKYIFIKSANSKILKFLHDLLDCGYCTSVWVGFFVAILFKDLELLFNVGWLNLLVLWLILHRGSNLVHTLIDLVSLKKEKLDLQEKEENL